MLPIEKLQKCSTLSDLALLLGYKPQSLSYILFKTLDKNKYTISEIPKKSGGIRVIKAPNPKLKLLQKHLADFLYKCEKQLIYNSLHKKAVSHGFKKELSIVTNAYNHRNKKYVFNIDLEDFFPSIHFGRVRGYFLKNKNFLLHKDIATLIAQIACHDNELPQGSPCSPVISNFIGHILDIRMLQLAKKAKCTYSRYVDDLTFSTNKKIFPSLIAEQLTGTEDQWKASDTLIKEIERAMFKINEKKTSMQYKTNRQVTTGLVVNEKVNIKNEYYRKARAMCHSLFTTDEFYVTKLILDPKAPSKSMEKEEKGQLRHLEGILGHIYYVKRPFELKKANGRKSSKPAGVTKLYKEFLLYKHFFALNKPLIVCEGKTDIIYLRSALRNLCSEYPNLIKNDSGKFSFQVRFLTFSKQLKEILYIAEGSGLVNLTKRYEDHIKMFKGSGKRHPVIMLADDDAGGKGLKDKVKSKLTNGELSAHISENMHAVFVPLNGQKESAIEDLFDSKTLSQVVRKKTFNPKNDKDNKQHYGKATFAKEVVAPSWKTIDFSKFKDVLNEFSTIISNHK